MSVSIARNLCPIPSPLSLYGLTFKTFETVSKSSGTKTYAISSSRFMGKEIDVAAAAACGPPRQHIYTAWAVRSFFNFVTPRNRSNRT